MVYNLFKLCICISDLKVDSLGSMSFSLLYEELFFCFMSFVNCQFDSIWWNKHLLWNSGLNWFSIKRPRINCTRGFAVLVHLPGCKTSLRANKAFFVYVFILTCFIVFADIGGKGMIKVPKKKVSRVALASINLTLCARRLTRSTSH